MGDDTHPDHPTHDRSGNVVSAQTTHQYAHTGDTNEHIDFRLSDTRHIGTYVKYENDAFKKMPQLGLTVHDKLILFLVDSSATYSVMRETLFPCPPTMTSANLTP